MFPDDSYEYCFFDPAIADPSRAEDYLKPEQRLNAIAEILATIALRAIKQNREAQSAKHKGESDAPIKKLTHVRTSPKARQQEGPA